MSLWEKAKNNVVVRYIRDNKDSLKMMAEGANRGAKISGLEGLIIASIGFLGLRRSRKNKQPPSPQP